LNNFCEDRGCWKLHRNVGAARRRLLWLAFMVVAQTFVLPGEAAEKPWGSADSAPSKLKAGPRYSFAICCVRVVLQAESTRLAPSLVSSIAKAAARPPHSTSGARELHEIGVALSKAVLEKNIETLLAYDREDLRAANAESLKNNKSDLYCYIFDSDRITWGDGTWRSVYEKISQAQKLEITVKVSSSPYDRQTYGSLFFYDASSVSAKDLRSRDFLCKEGPGRIASWKFLLERGKWKAVTPLFDSETRAGCPDDAPEKE